MADRDAILPQQGTHAVAIVSSVQWLFEPYWPGDRLIARLEDGQVSITDAAGQPAAPELVEVASLLAAAIDADAAVVDGIWTSQPFVGQRERARRGTETLVPVPDRSAMETRRAFVAIDLLELEGAPLYDVPLQERRRLLASVVAEDVRVRISPAVKLPLRPWVDAWRADGFAHYVAKHVNSRYRPGEQVDDWLIISAEPERRASVMGRMFGHRPRKPRRIED